MLHASVFLAAACGAEQSTREESSRVWASVGQGKEGEKKVYS